ncbi:hypothetical protein [Arthrobacter echini]|uniref:hypothetical protein n=1 Tax=Arthrobacter echini TaxID=1529066 RepID=UPI001651C121|nr:hypothetical protein [Arthrobacter echini]
MSDQFRGKIERSSFGTSAAKAARSSVPMKKAQSLVSRSMAAKKTAETRNPKREGK